MVYYRDLEPSDVAAIPPELRKLAADVVAFACEELRITPPMLFWFTQTTSDAKGCFSKPIDILGEANYLRQIVRVKQTFDERQIVETLSHELRHLWQSSKGHVAALRAQVTDSDHARAEGDAEEYARGFAERFKAGTPLDRPPAFGPGRDELTRLTHELAALKSAFVV